MEVNNQLNKIPAIVGDIGGTSSRLSLVRMTTKYGDDVEYIKLEILPSKNYKSISHILKEFLRPFEGTENYPVIGVIGIPGPVFNNKITIIANLDWPETTGEDEANILNLESMTFLNDFVTNGYGILSNIKEGEHYEKINNNVVDNRGPIAMIGAGTGLGHGYLVKHEHGKYYHVFASEGGHQDFAPQNELQWGFHKFLAQQFNVSHISVERAVSGPAVPLMLQFFIEIEKMESPIFKSHEQIKNTTSYDVIKHGLDKTCTVCEKVIEFFVELYASAAGNISLLLLPTGGLYLLGGLSWALEDYMIKEDVFRNNFVNKGRLKPILEKIPIFTVKDRLIGVKGAEEYARRMLEKR